MLVNENAELRCEVERLCEQLDTERWDSFNAVLSCGVDERDVDRTFEGLSEHGVRKPREIREGNAIPDDVLIVIPADANDCDRFAVRVAAGAWRYVTDLAEAQRLLESAPASGFRYFDSWEYPLTEVLPATIAKAS